MSSPKPIREQFTIKLLSQILPFWSIEITQRERDIIHEVLIEGKSFGKLMSAPLLTSFRQRQIFAHGISRLIKRIKHSQDQLTKRDSNKTELTKALQKIKELESQLAKAQLVKDQPKEKIPDKLRKLLNTKIEDTKLSQRVKSACRYADVKRLYDLVRLSKRDFLRMRNCGMLSVREVEGFLKQNDLSFGMEFDTA